MMIRAAAIQHDIVWEDPPANFGRMAPRIADAAHRGARLAVLSEMWSTGFSMRSDRIAEQSDGPTTTFMLEQAAEHDLWVAGSVPVVTPDGRLPVNRFVLAGPDGATHTYDKIHPFTMSGEHEHYSAGSGVMTAVIDGVKVTPLVCYDLRFADLFWDVAADTDCYIVPANWPESRSRHWIVLLRARAIENQAYVIGVNRVGRAGRLTYSGDTRIIGPMGDEITAEPGVEETIIADIDQDFVAATRRDFPFMVDR